MTHRARFVLTGSASESPPAVDKPRSGRGSLFDTDEVARDLSGESTWYDCEPCDIRLDITTRGLRRVKRDHEASKGHTKRTETT